MLPIMEKSCNMAFMEHATWIEKISQGDSAREIGRKTGIPFRTVTTQINRGRISAENVIIIATTYGTHPVRALVDCDYLEAEYAATTDPTTAIQSVSDVDLANEVLRRLTGQPKPAALDGTITSMEERRALKAEATDAEPLPERERYVAKKRTKELFEGDDGHGGDGA